MRPQVGDIWTYVADPDRKKYLFLKELERRYDEVLFEALCLDTGGYTDAWYSELDTSIWEFVA